MFELQCPSQLLWTFLTSDTNISLCERGDVHIEDEDVNFGKMMRLKPCLSMTSLYCCVPHSWRDKLLYFPLVLIWKQFWVCGDAVEERITPDYKKKQIKTNFTATASFRLLKLLWGCLRTNALFHMIQDKTLLLNLDHMCLAKFVL